VVNPPVPRTPSSRASILRGRELFLSLNKTGNKVDCTSCHGPQAIGDGPSFVTQDVFNYVVFGGSPSNQQARLDELVKEREEKLREELKEHPPEPSDLEKRVKEEGEKLRAAWKNSLDDWGNPFRPANLNRGVYKGGRRPIDLYWRIAKGINGAKMMAHYPTIEPEKIWDLVNFVLALPYEPDLLEGATLPGAVPTPPGASVAGR
jgi:mono/diheme cytochrome c family protein